MAKADFGSAKYLSKQMKASGLQRLRFYCQVCQKQCRDENGFKAHTRSPSHLKNISKISEADIDEYTRAFEAEFLKLLRLSHGEKKIEANKFYNQFIQDKDHTHMNATRFTSLTRFILHLSNTSKIRVEGKSAELAADTDPAQLLISYIDNSNENLLRKAALDEIEAKESSEQHIKAKLLQRQIESCFKQTEAEKNSKKSPDASDTHVAGPESVSIHFKPKINVVKVAKKKIKPKRKNLFQ